MEPVPCTPPSQDYSPVDDLWFDDGNVVIAAKSRLFRVHRSILSLQSSVFRDILSLPASEEQDMYEGHPLIELPDDGEEVEHFLKAIYLPQYFPSAKGPNDLPFEAVVGALRLAHKYDVPFLRRRALRVFSAEYILDIDKIETMPTPWWRRSDPHREDDVTWSKFVTEILLAREVGALWVLPQLLFEASYEHVERLVSSQLSQADVNNCYAGFQKVGEAKLLGTLLFQELVNAGCNYKCFQNPNGIMFALEAAGKLSDPIQLFSRDIEQRTRVAVLCAKCKERIIERYRQWRKDFWTSLPGQYSLPDCKELKEMRRKALEVFFTCRGLIDSCIWTPLA
ncbi:hypothetical protein BD626DRAFT_266851 [Schizophyllum amplum]|uniref:BTB domain-containing protein n=1 Tax=Schizophyllum amplum TaxID=97359 RepID=A0A550BS72_9AGAR|nr:hypothetical protein BD626DRAFT_77173 [Auriculariopsis ampla]TRM56090.1 hypothetical protein BD626DRAFT_266851 [Auriculariopsis ampla]